MGLWKVTHGEECSIHSVHEPLQDSEGWHLGALFPTRNAPSSLRVVQERDAAGSLGRYTSLQRTGGQRGYNGTCPGPWMQGPP